MQQKCVVSSLILEILEPLLAKINNLNPDLRTQLNQLASLSFPRTQEEVNDLVGPFFNAYPQTFDTFYYQTHFKIFTFIVENNIEGLRVMFTAGEYLFRNGINLQQPNRTGQTLLCCAISYLRRDIVSLLLGRGAIVNLPIDVFLNQRNSPICCAVEARSEDMVNLLVAHGLTVETVNGEPQKGTSPLYLAARLGETEIVRVLIANGASLNSTRNGVIVGETSDFNSPLKVALVNKKLVIANFLFDIIKKDRKLFAESLPIFFKYAPLDLLENYIDDLVLTHEEKFATLVVTRVKRDQITDQEWSGKVLLECLLSSAVNAEQRLKIIAKIIKQLMRLEFLDPRIQTEPCFAEKPLLEQIASEVGDYPIITTAKKLLRSIDAATKQGRGNVGLRLIRAVAMSSDNAQFTLGLKFIEKLIGVLIRVYQTQPVWPIESTIDTLIQEQFEAADLKPPLDLDSRSCEEKIRFRAIVGSVPFSRITHVPVLSYRGSYYFTDILRVIFRILNKHDMLKANWDVQKAQRLLTNIEDHQLLNENTGVMSTQLRAPEHVIPILIYQQEDRWIYTVICRSFLEPNGVVQFDIPNSNFARVLPLITKELHENDMRPSRSTNTDREIYYRIFCHLLFLEKLLNRRGVYATTWFHKPYKYPTCFVSNLKPVLNILITLVQKESVTTEKMEHFLSAIRAKILAQIQKANISDVSEQLVSTSEQNTLAPNKLIYKYVTLLMRWREINRYHPVHEEELEAKDKSVEHVVEHTRKRFNTRVNFFNLVAQNDSRTSAANQSAPGL